MDSKRFGRKSLKAFLQFARPSPEGGGTILLGVSDPLGGQPRQDKQVAKKKVKEHPPQDPE